MTGRPSYLLQKLVPTASKLGVTEDFVRHKFIHALPTSIFPVTQKSLSLQQLGSLADELMPFINEETSHMVSTPSTLSLHNKHSNNDSNNKATNVVRTNALVNAIGTFIALVSLVVNGLTKASAKSNLPQESPHLPHLDIHSPFLRTRKTTKASRSCNYSKLLHSKLLHQSCCIRSCI